MESIQSQENREGLTKVRTADGSDTLFHNGINEHFHSSFGAVQESKHIFIDAGLKFCIRNHFRINVLEVGYGTGLNALLSCLEISNSHFFINYLGLEPFPVQTEMLSVLNYPEFLAQPAALDIFRQISTSDWDSSLSILPNFNLTKRKARLQETILSPENYHLVFLDAFSPEVQPDMWTAEVFEQIFTSMVHKGILVTYCCKGHVKRAAKSVGFLVEKLPGPPGKREILRLMKD